MQTYFINLYKRGKDVVQGDDVFTTDGAAYCEVLETHGEDYQYICTLNNTGEEIIFPVREIEQDQLDHDASLREAYVDWRERVLP